MAERLAALRGRVAAAAVEAERDPAAVSLLPVSKAHPVAALRQAAGLGLRQFGESYVSEAVAKIDELGDLGAEWYFLGPIQSNKTRPIAERFDWALGLSSSRVARRLSDQRPEGRPPLRVCVQVNVDDDPAKSGVAVAELEPLLDVTDTLPGIEVRGLMTIPMRPQPGQAPSVEKTFTVLAELYHAQVAGGRRWDTLSMGMSGDFEAAVACGSTQIRLGTALFGQRTPVAERKHGDV
jgi:pyridoxal phosphate enzyme (YggS family)